MDYYSILNVNKNASQDEIKANFRRLAMKYHPDRNQNNPSAEEQFKKIKEAYDVLSDPKKRAEYDNPGPQFADFGGISPEFEDILRSFNFGFRGFGGFGPTQSARPQRTNRNLTVRAVVNLQEVLNGKEIIGTITLPSGEDQALNLKIPRGVKNGDHIRFPGLGDNSIKELPRGDLIVTITESQDPNFVRNGHNVLTEVKVSVLTLLTGGTVEINNFDGRTLQFKVPAGANPNATFACAKQGLPKGDSNERGDLFVKLIITVPLLSTEDLALVEGIKFKYD